MTSQEDFSFGPAPSNRSVAAKRRGRIFAVVALLVAGGALVAITAGGIGENLVYYWSPSDLRNAGNKAYGATIRLGGQVAQNSVVMGTGASQLSFDVVDGKARVPVRSTGVPPQMFREGIGVVVEGTMTRAGHFECSRLMVSHSNEYQAPSGKDPVDTKNLMKTTEGLSEAK